jgi:hypothetical protein
MAVEELLSSAGVKSATELFVSETRALEEAVEAEEAELDVLDTADYDPALLASYMSRRD